MKLTPDKQVIAAALDVLASLSASRYRLLLSDKRQSQPIVGLGALRRLADKLEEHYPGLVEKVRKENEAWRAAKRAEEAHS